MAQTMEGYVCWNEEMISRVLETETEQVEDHTFLASHTPIKMYRESNSSLAKSSLVPYSESRFLQDFLKRDNYMLATVLGDVGTGKTHLIRWLHARLPNSEKRKVILIPRFGTNLRKIISLILEGMEGPQFDEYRQKLKSVDDDLTPERAREYLLANLAVEIGPNGPHNQGDLTEEEEYMAEMLPALFHDVFFREILLKDGGIIHALTDHAVGSKNKIERVTERRKFTKEDLPTDITDIDKASADARMIYSELLDNEVKEMAVQWINKHIHHAMSRLLSFQGGDLVKMMNDVRAELAKDGIELILLFEDFAVTEGIDRQLLEALLIRPNAAKNMIKKELCAIRIALACTTGYYEDLRDTIQNRVELKVSLDVETGDMFTGEDMEAFVSRYLNVLRYPDKVVEDWYHEMLDSGESSVLPSACEKLECPLIERCHGSFGDNQNKGLYPFNKQAIETMYNRLFKEENPKFNPRMMIKDVIRRTLEDYTGYIRDGEFPPPAMFERFGGKTKNRLSALDIRQLGTLDLVSADRREVLLEFWSNSKEIVNLPEPIHEAFRFVDLDIETSRHPSPQEAGREDADGNRTDQGEKEKQDGTAATADQKSVKPSEEEVTQALLDQIQEIEMWKNNGSLSQTLMQRLRENIFTAINSYIDWDSEHLHLRSLREEGIWKQRFVHFKRSTAITPSIVQLVLPLEDERLNDTAIVLQGILYYSHYKHWHFENGSQYYRYFTRYLHRWSNHVLSQLKELTSKHGDPIPVISMATDILAGGAALSGRSLGKSLTDSIDALFYPMNETGEYRSEGWRKLHQRLKQSEQEIKNNAYTRLGIFKGQTKPFRLIDSAQLIKPLQSLRKGEFSAAGIQDTGSDFKTLIKNHHQLREMFESVIQEDLSEKVQWLSKMEEAFGPKLQVKEGLEDLRNAMNSASNDGSFRGGKSRESLLALVKDMEAMPVKGWANQIKAAENEDHFIKKAQMLGDLDTDRMFKAKTFLETADRFLEESLRSVKMSISDLKKDQESKEISEITREIEQQFERLIDMTDHLKREDSNDTNKSELTTPTHS